MGSIDIIKPLSTDLSSAINKYQQHLEKNLGNVENQPRVARWEASKLPLCYSAPQNKFFVTRWCSCRATRNRCRRGTRCSSSTSLAPSCRWISRKILFKENVEMSEKPLLSLGFTFRGSRRVKKFFQTNQVKACHSVIIRLKVVQLSWLRELKLSLVIQNQTELSGVRANNMLAAKILDTFSL